MTKTRKGTKVLAIVAITLIIALTALFFLAFGDASADVDSGDAPDVMSEATEEAEGNWFVENWKTVVEILTSSTAMAVIIAILKALASNSRLGKKIEITNTDNSGLKTAFNSMADEIETQSDQLKEFRKLITTILNAIETNTNKTSAMLDILGNLINSSDLPTEVKIAYQGLINKANGAEGSANDEG